MKFFTRFKLLTLLLVMTLLACQPDEPVLSQLVAPTNINVEVNVSQDQSGRVTITPFGEGVLYYHVYFTEDNPVVLNPGETASYRFTQSGVYSKNIGVVAYGPGGLSSSRSVEIDLDVKLQIDATTLAQIAGTGTKRWVWDRTNPGHFGVGPLTNRFPEYFSASPNQLNPCLYDDVLIFSYDEIGNYSFTLDPGAEGLTFMNWTEVNRFFPDASPVQYEDECRDITTFTSFQDSFTILDGEAGERMLDLGQGFMSYWAIISGEYDILELNEDKLTVRGISSPFNGDTPLAWYFSFVPEGDIVDDYQELTTQFNSLVWADEFDVDGAPNPQNWGYDLGSNNGWGNQELQSYTNSPDNVKVENGELIITSLINEVGDGSYYFDNITLSNSGQTNSTTLEDFEGTVTFGGFGGASATIASNPDVGAANGSSNAGRLDKPAQAEVWAGIFFEASGPIDFQATPIVSMQTYSSKVDAVVKLKIEDSTSPPLNDGSPSVFYEVDQFTSVENGWETLTYDFSNAPEGNYDRIVLFFDFGATGQNSYTSARIKSENLYEFTYGRVDVKAKLPVSQGTWPALWMLGANFDQVGWPSCGEIDIMEQTGQDKTGVGATVHFPNSAGTGPSFITSSRTIENSEEYHIYTVEWRQEEIIFAADNEIYHRVTNVSELPFNSDFFLILNVAMGGTLGGLVDPNFTSDQMVVDYVRVYQ